MSEAKLKLLEARRSQLFGELLSRLKGSALSVCAGIPATGGNYDTIFTSLIDRYQDKRALAAAYMDKIINFSPIKMESRENYQEFLDQTYSSVPVTKRQEVTAVQQELHHHQDAGSSHITTLCSSSLEHQRQNTTVLLSTVKVAVQTVKHPHWRLSCRDSGPWRKSPYPLNHCQRRMHTVKRSSNPHASVKWMAATA
uniref:Uncharacterized protein n=1 Tax=Cacopsylla melanoneura TaxID=428564 RepID=A0A8D9B5S7_9HEMI